jgi:hypothetical protein
VFFLFAEDYDDSLKMLAVSSLRAYDRPEQNDSDNKLEKCAAGASPTGSLTAVLMDDNVQLDRMIPVPSQCEVPLDAVPSEEKLSKSVPLPVPPEPLAAVPVTEINTEIPSVTGFGNESDDAQDALKRKRPFPVDEGGEGAVPKKRRPRRKPFDFDAISVDIEPNPSVKRRSRKKQFDIDAGDKVFTDNFDEVCKCSCKYCDKVLTMDEFRVHLRVVHSETIHDYRKKFGEMEFVSLTYHRL